LIWKLSVFEKEVDRVGFAWGLAAESTFAEDESFGEGVYQRGHGKSGNGKIGKIIKLGEKRTFFEIMGLDILNLIGREVLS